MAGTLVPSFEAGRWVGRGRLLRVVNGQPVAGQWLRLACRRPFTITVVSDEASGNVANTLLWVANGVAEPPPLIVAGTVRGAAPLAVNITTAVTITYDLPFEWIAAIASNAQAATLVDLAVG